MADRRDSTLVPFTSEPVVCDEASTHLYVCPAGVTADSTSRGREWTVFVMPNNDKTRSMGTSKTNREKI